MRVASVRRACCVVAAAVAVVTLAQPAIAQDEIWNPPGTWNGKKVYLSPARHSDTGSRGECQGRSENSMAFDSTRQMTNSVYYKDRYDPSHPWRSLRSRGYKVRIGRGTLSSAVSNSNAWGADVHIPVHSNAIGSDRCSNTDRYRPGTLVIYKTGAGQALSTKLNDRVGPRSPGRVDRTCHVSSTCTPYSCLAELCQTSAPSAYLESEFHTWNPGIEFLTRSHNWAWRVGLAVDEYLGYPRR